MDFFPSTPLSCVSNPLRLLLIATLLSISYSQSPATLFSTCSQTNPSACFFQRAVDCETCFNGSRGYLCSLFANEIYRQDLGKYAFGKVILSNIPSQKFDILLGIPTDVVTPYCLGFKELFLSRTTNELNLGNNYTIASEGVSVQLANLIQTITSTSVSVLTEVIFEKKIPTQFATIRQSLVLNTDESIRRLADSDRTPTFSKHTITSSRKLREGAIAKAVRRLPNLTGWQQYYLRNTNAFRVVRISSRKYIVFIPFRKFVA